MRTAILAIVPLLALAGCADRPPRDDTSDTDVPSREMFAGLPVFPGSRLVAGSATAAEARVSVPVSADSVANYYRQALTVRNWVIRGDATDADGTVTLHAGSDEGRPIWIRIVPVSADACEVSFIATASRDSGAS
jgi:hypothetical protein